MQAWLSRVRTAAHRPDPNASATTTAPVSGPRPIQRPPRSSQKERGGGIEEKSQVSASATGASATGWNWFRRKPTSRQDRDETSSDGSAVKSQLGASTRLATPDRATPPPAYVPPPQKSNTGQWRLWGPGGRKKPSGRASSPADVTLPTHRPPGNVSAPPRLANISSPPRLQSAPVRPAPFRSQQSVKAKLSLPLRGPTGASKLKALPAGLPRPRGPPRSKLLATLTALTFPPPADVVNNIQREKFDPLHDPDAKFWADSRKTHRTCCDLTFIIVLLLILLSIFLALPVTVYLLKYVKELAASAKTIGPDGFKNVPMNNVRDLIDPDTPSNVRARTGYDGKAYQLVFSDEFNVDGRTFYAGDDPYWVAENMWNGNSNDLQWYDPGQVETKDGSLVITMDKRDTHNLSYVSGMVHGWNKLCITGGYVEVRVSLPGDTSTPGLWPAAWMLGNLGRVGYGSTLDGLWPYSYDSCDVGTLPNQTAPGGTKLVPNALAGQRLSACTCPSDDHPGPKVGKRWTGRGAPELDIMEGYIDATNGPTLSTGLPVAPFDQKMQFVQNSNTFALYESTYDPTFAGFGGTSQAEYAVVRSKIPTNAYERAGGQFQTFGLEWSPGYTGKGSVVVSQGGEQAWKITSDAYPASSVMGIGNRPISSEPSYIILNLAMSTNFHEVDEDNLVFPVRYLVDYVRVYQRTDMVDVTCDPDRAPTAAYIDRHQDAYGTATNNTWSQVRSANGTWPRNSLVDDC